MASSGGSSTHEQAPSKRARVLYPHAVARTIGEAALRSPLPQIVSLFQPKGGVGKSTIAYHLGHCVAMRGKRVLLVDCDPLCGLTNLCSLESREDPDWRRDVEAGDLHTALLPLLGEETRHHFRPAAVVQLPLRDQVHEGGKLCLLPGSVLLHGFIRRLSAAYSTMLCVVARDQHLIGAVRQLLLATALAHDCDTIVADLAPSTERLNQDVLIHSDAFVIPVQPDTLSLQSLRHIHHVMVEWFSESAAGGGGGGGDGGGGGGRRVPRFLGVIHTHCRTNGVEDTWYWHALINDFLFAKLAPRFQQLGMSLPHDLEAYVRHGGGGDGDYTIGKLPECSLSLALVQRVAKPLFDLQVELIRAQFLERPDCLEATGIQFDAQQRAVRGFMRIAERVSHVMDALVETAATVDV